MDSQVPDESLPQIVVTEPSPMIPPSVSVMGKAETAPVEIKQNTVPVANGTTVTMEPTKTSPQEETAVLEPESSSSQEFAPAPECKDCVVSVPEQPESRSGDDTTTGTLEPEQDDFRNITETGFSPVFGIQYIIYYMTVWDIIHSKYAIPIWLLLEALPLSAGVMGGLYMYSCPAAHSIATLIFIIGISLMVVISLRICLIIHRLTEEQNCSNMLHTLLLISTFLTAVFFVTESVAYWRMESTSLLGTEKYCDPVFLKYSFWWNCITPVVIVSLFLFPA